MTEGDIPQLNKDTNKTPLYIAVLSWHDSCSVIIVMFIRRILKIGLVAIVASALTTTQAQVPQPAPKPDKPEREKPDKKKWDRDKVKDSRTRFMSKSQNGHSDVASPIVSV